mmetsp:Transcript_29006/g.35250  ORF Transcript_29006/g.35250 Transcript_29006/m.35250 type:complete len:204 (-) Transcript_29006:255-866(-)
MLHVLFHCKLENYHRTSLVRVRIGPRVKTRTRRRRLGRGLKTCNTCDTPPCGLIVSIIARIPHSRHHAVHTRFKATFAACLHFTLLSAEALIATHVTSLTLCLLCAHGGNIRMECKCLLVDCHWIPDVQESILIGRCDWCLILIGRPSWHTTRTRLENGLEGWGDLLRRYQWMWQWMHFTNDDVCVLKGVVFFTQFVIIIFIA